MNENPYWEVAKYAFAAVGGGAVAVGCYKLTMRLADKVYGKVGVVSVEDSNEE